MAIPFLNNITLNNNEVQNVKLHNTGSAPNNAAGQIYFDTSDNLAKYYSNATDLWIDLKEYSFSNGTYIDVTTTGTTPKPIFTLDISAVDGTAGAGERYLTKNNTWAEVAAIPGTTYDLSVQAGGSNTSVIRLSGSDTTDDDVTISGTSTTVKVTEAGNTITLDLQDDVTIVNDLTVGGDINVTGSLNSYTTSELLVQDQYITLNSGQTTPVLDAFVKVERGATDVALKWNETTDRWQFTNDGSTYYNIPISTEYNNYTHPTHPGDDIDVDTGALTGATVVSDIDINITTDTLGHVTDANGSISTRTLTLGDLGYTGATDADNYGSWTIQDGDTTTYTITSGDTLQIASGGGITSNFTADDVLTISHNDTSSVSDTSNSGLTVIQDLTFDTYGHVTGVTSSDISSEVVGEITGREYVTTITDTDTVTHNLGSRDVMVQLYDVTTYETVYADVERTTTSAVDITFASTPTNSIRVLITKIG